MFLLVVFMGVILSDSVDARDNSRWFIGNLNQGTSGDSTLLAGNGFHYVARSFATGFNNLGYRPCPNCYNNRGYILHAVGVQVHTSSASRRATVGIYEDNNGVPGNKLYDLTGSITSTGVRNFTAPPGSTLERSTRVDKTYWVVIGVGSGSGAFRLDGTGSTIADTNPDSNIAWSLGSQSRYTRNGVHSFHNGGIKIALFGKDRLYDRPHTGRPSISSAAPDGVIQVNHTLTANISRISDRNGIVDDSIRYQWILVDSTAGTGTDISGATSSTYTPIDNYVGSRLKVRVSFIDEDAYSASVVSAVSDVVRSVEGNAPAVGKPVINGTFKFGQTLTVDTSGIGDENGIPSSFRYQWVRVDGGTETDILGATGGTYTVVSDDEGKRLKVKVSFTDDGGFSEGPLVSDATVRVWSIDFLVGNINQPFGSDGTVINDSNFVAHQFTTGNHSNGYNVTLISVKVYGASSTRVPVISIYSSSDGTPGVKLYEFNGSVAEAGDRNFIAVGRVGPRWGVPLSPDTSYFVHVAGGNGSGFFKVRSGVRGATDFDSSSLPGWGISSSHRRSSNGGGRWIRYADFGPRFSVWGFPRLSPLPFVNSPPVFSGSSNFSVSENFRVVGTVAVFDGDVEDNVTSYSVSGGADSSRFSINEDGVLSFRAAPNFESPSDSGRNNEYVVDVKVGSGSGGRERFSTRTFIVRVTDVLEIPFAPGAPALTSLNSSSLLVSWDVPRNTGPSINDYDVEYGADGVSFADWSHDGVFRRATITGLNASTLYYVRVRARNDEGGGSWSQTSYVRTAADTITTVNESFLVGNINQALGRDGTVINDSNFVAHQFTTGNHSVGYVVSRVVVKIHTASSTRVPVVSIYSNNGGMPGVKLYDLNGSVTETGDRNFTAPSSGVSLSPSTSYFVHVAGGNGSGFFKVRSGLRGATDFDSSSLPGWSISSSHRRSSNGGGRWIRYADFGPRFSVWGSEKSGSLPDVNVVPAFSSSSSFSVSENSVGVGAVVAVDGDSEDNVTGYSVSGGVDRSLFSITSGGVLSFVSAPDFENPSDNGRNNVYDLVVTAMSGTSARVRSANQSITVTVIDVAEGGPPPPGTNNPPVFSSGSGFSVNENVRGVGVVVASDNDSQDSVTGYVVSGGVDSALFSITSVGVLSFDSVPNYEAPVDVGGNNVYDLVVTATSGTGGRLQTAIQTITVTVVDVVEAPSAPGRPVLGSPSSTSLSVSWSLPGNTGPSIIDYDVGYGRNSNGPFTDWSHSDASRSATITGLNASTLYYVRVRAGNAEGSSGWSPTASFTTGTTVTNNPPVFSSSSGFSVNENTVSVGTVVASDNDVQDSVTAYTLGGVDRNSFSITSGGVLTFLSAPDFENPVDSGGNNVYNLIVTAYSGQYSNIPADSRVRTATQSITVTVVDVEVPSVPSAPVLSSPSSTSLLVSWSAPGGTGPAISDYDVGYGRNSNGPFTDWLHSGTSRSATITGLNASTLYYVRVLARNAEGDSSWSPTANFTTGTTVTNNPPVFSSGSSFSVNENVRGVGTVVASDRDSLDGVSGYRVSGGVDSAFFSITNGGVLTFNSAPDYESPADSGGNNVYNLVVTATSGTGSRVHTATQSITVTVNDVDEMVSVIPPQDVVLVYRCV